MILVNSISSSKFNSTGKTIPQSSRPMGHDPLSVETDKTIKTMGHDPLSRKKKTQNHLWSQKFFYANLDVWKLATLSKRVGYTYDDPYIGNAIRYIQNNRIKHQLPASDTLQKLIEDFTMSSEKAFELEYKGGFDVVIGNPPYVRQELLSEIKPFLEESYQSFAGTADLFTYFYEKGLQILNKNGFLSFITNDYNKTKSSTSLRKYLKEQTGFIAFDDLSEVDVFKGTTTYPVILTLSHQKNPTFKYCKFEEKDTGILC